MSWRTWHRCGENHAERVQPPLERLHPRKRVVLAQRRRLQVDVLAEQLRRADEGDALGLGPPLCRGDLVGHRRIIGIAKEDVDPIEATGDDLAADQLLDGADAVGMLAQVQDLARRDAPPRPRFRQSDAYSRRGSAWPP
jgi:hypothetical protein